MDMWQGSIFSLTMRALEAIEFQTEQSTDVLLEQEGVHFIELHLKLILDYGYQ